MTYTELGFSKLLYKGKNNGQSVEYSDDSSSLAIPILNGSSISGGITRSASGRIQIDWEKGQILIGDGATWRVLIGDDGL